jgi:hypothetical protein
MSKQTNYNELKNTLIVISFNQPTGEHGQDIQPIQIEARTEPLTDEGAVRNVRNIVNIGEPVQVKLTNEEIYKQVFGISEVLAKALEGVLLDAVDSDMTVVDTSAVKPVAIADIYVKPVEAVEKL